MHDVSIALEPIDEPGPLSLYLAATDELARRYGSGADQHETSTAQLAAPSGFFLVARRDGHLLGGVGLRTIARGDTRVGEVKRLWVRPDVRRSGVAAALMDALIAEARREGFDELYLETGPAQPEARSFYDATGWQRVESLPEGAVSYPEAFKYYLDLRSAMK